LLVPSRGLGPSSATTVPFTFLASIRGTNDRIQTTMNDGMNQLQQSIIRYCVKRRDALERLYATLPLHCDERLMVRGKLTAYKEVLARLTHNSPIAMALKKEFSKCEA
jgi:hypothetical protein